MTRQFWSVVVAAVFLHAREAELVFTFQTYCEYCRMLKSPKTASQIDVSASCNSYTCWCPSAVWQNTLYWILTIFVSLKMHLQMRDILATVYRFWPRCRPVSTIQLILTIIFYFLALLIVRKWYCPQHIVASTLLKPSSWGTLFLIPPTVCTNRISTLSKPRFCSTHVQDPWNILTSQTSDSIVSSFLLNS